MSEKTGSSRLQCADRLGLVAKAIDCGIVFGQGRDNEFEYSTPEEAILARGRLGIGRGFVSSLTSESLSTLEAAREVSAFCLSQTARSRFFPAFTLHPSELFADGAEEEFASIIRMSPSCLFNLCINGQDALFRLGLQFLVEKGGRRNIVVCFRVGQAPPLSSLIEMARKHPKIRFVLTEHNWGQDSYVHAAMTEAVNIFADTSLGHTCDHIEILVARYGAERILFSLGYRSLGGASLGAILGAKISEREKAAILYRNISGLLKISPVVGANNSELTDGVWKTFLTTGSPGFPIIDCHGHFGPVAAWSIKEQAESRQIPRKRFEMSEQKLEYFIFSHTRALFGNARDGNRIAEDQVIAADDPRLLAYFVYNPRYAADLEPYLTKIPFSKVFIGFKILCDYWKTELTDSAFDPMWKIADRFRLPVLIHTWNTMYNAPAMIAPIAKRYPNVRYILAHCGGDDVGRKQAEDAARKFPNVYLEWCGSFHSRRPWEDTIRDIGASKLVFGTDAVFHGHDWELSRLLSVPLEDAVFRQILHDTFAGIVRPLLKKRTLRSIF